MRRAKKYVKRYGYSSFPKKYKKQLLNTVLNAVKTASKKVVHKESEFIGNKNAGGVTKSNGNKIVKQEPAEKTIIPPEKGEETLNKLRKLL